jgi:hypothetical protein
MIATEMGAGNQAMAEDTASQNALMSGLGSAGNIAGNIYSQNKTRDYLSSLFANTSQGTGALRSTSPKLNLL